MAFLLLPFIITLEPAGCRPATKENTLKELLRSEKEDFRFPEGELIRDNKIIHEVN